MPPKKQILKQQIIEKAFEIVRRDGYEALSARKLAKELNCSTQPIYQAYSDMKELKTELVEKAQEQMVRYIIGTRDEELPIGLSYILSYVRFSVDERYLFQLIFTSDGLNMDLWRELSAEDMNLNFNMIVYANGIIMMLAYKALEPSYEKIKEMLTHAYEGFERK